jgi:polysaccharide export outer membrane protein
MPLQHSIKKKYLIQRISGRWGLSLILKAFLISGIFFGCVTNQPQPQQEYNYSFNDDEIDEINEHILASAYVSSDPSDYLLGAGDLIQISVFEAKELDSKVRISSRGYITLPLLGPVEVKGLSAREAEQKIEDLYRERYIKDPHVGIFIEEHFSRRVTLMGQFKNPGTYDYLSKQRLLDVMAMGGGLGEKAGLVVQIRKSSGSPDGQSVVIVDLDQLIKAGRSELNIKINAGDVLFVPEAGVFFVDGAVRNPGSYYIKHQTTVQEAFVEAGGLRPYANKEKAVLVRYIENEKRQIIILDLTQPDTLEIKLKDRDVLIAEATTFGKLTHGMGFFIGFPGIGGVGYRDPALRY